MGILFSFQILPSFNLFTKNLSLEGLSNDELWVLDGLGNHKSQSDENNEGRNIEPYAWKGEVID